MEEDYLWEKIFEELLGGGEEKRQQMLQRQRKIEEGKKVAEVKAAPAEVKPAEQRNHKHKKGQSLGPRKKTAKVNAAAKAKAKVEEEKKKEEEKARQEAEAAAALRKEQEDVWSWKKELYKAMRAQKDLR